MEITIFKENQKLSFFLKLIKSVIIFFISFLKITIVLHAVAKCKITVINKLSFANLFSPRITLKISR